MIFEGSLSPPTFVRILTDQLALRGLDIYLVGGRLGRETKKTSPQVNLMDTGNNQSWLSLVNAAIRLSIRLMFFDPAALFASLKFLSRIFMGSSPTACLKVFNLRNTVALIKPDIIHIQWASHIGLFTWLLDAETRFRPGIVLSLRGRLVNVSSYVEPAVARLYQACFPKVHAFHAVSAAIALKAQNWGAPNDRIRVIFSGLELQKLATFRKTSWQLQTMPKVLMVGRFHWIKGYGYAFDALRILLNEGINLHYVLIAGQPPEELLYDMQEASLDKYVQFLPNMPQEAVFQQMQQSDILLLPSVEEGIANVVLEAMAVGLPVLSSDCGGMREVIEHNVNGLLFENRNVSDLVRQLKAMIGKEPAEREQLAIAGRRTVTQRFGADRLGWEMKMLYQAVMEDHLYRDN